MAVAFIAFIAIALVGLCILREIIWRDERQNWRNERIELLQRIQAPQMAVVAEQEPTAYVAPDDDEGYWQAVAEREAE
jgi:hypothetical protein